MGIIATAEVPKSLKRFSAILINQLLIACAHWANLRDNLMA